jgi:Na+-transporting NADH:ubiquinone oxidoreductase subunit A
MGVTKIKKGLDLPIQGEPSTELDESKVVKKVALLGNDYVGLKPTLAVSVGEKVKLGQLLFTDKKMEGVKYTSPGTGTVIEINRGEKRHFLSIVIELEGNEEITFKTFSDSEIPSIKKDVIKDQLIESGLWTSIRERPFSKVANPAVEPKAIFVTAMDSNPLAPSVPKILEGKEASFKNGLRVLSKLTDGTLYLCKEEGSTIPETQLHNLKVEEFSGVHPKGLPGTHIHFLDNAHRNKKIWYLNAQDVVAIGLLFTTGKINVERILALGGPAVKNPRYIKTRIGAYIDDLVQGELTDVSARVISGSVLFGRKATAVEGFVGRYNQQISVIEEHTKRDFLGWVMPSSKLYSYKESDAF